MIKKSAHIHNCICNATARQLKHHYKYMSWLQEKNEHEYSITHPKYWDNQYWGVIIYCHIAFRPGYCPCYL